MPFSETVKTKAFVACKRSCCICHKFSGLKMELHHIEHESEGGDDTFENAIPLCFDCHADMRSYDSKHPKGNKYTRKELKQHRDNWYGRVEGTPVAQYDANATNLDEGLLRKIQEILPWDGAILVARRHLFSTPFERESLEAFYKYKENLSDPSFEFIDTDLESFRASLSSSIINFMNAVEINTYVVDGNEKLSSVPREWKSQQREAYVKAISDLQEAGTQVGAAYDDMIRSGRRKLRVPTSN
jgi:hypothetical protein